MKSDPVSELEDIFNPTIKLIKEVFPGAVVLPPERKVIAKKPVKEPEKPTVIIKSKTSPPQQLYLQG